MRDDTLKNVPFMLKPAAKDYLWGGQRLNDDFEKNIDMDPLAETWECSTHPDGPSVVSGGEFDGKLLIDVLKEKGIDTNRTQFFCDNLNVNLDKQIK